MVKDIILLVAGTILGYIFPFIIIKWNKYRIEQKIASRREIFSSESVSAWLGRYYKKNDSTSSLFHFEIDGDPQQIPFLVKSDWLIYKKLNKNDDMLRFVASQKQFKIDKKLIAQKLKLNQTIFNEPALYIDNLSVTNHSLLVEVKKCSYFEMISAMSRLEEENFNAIKHNKLVKLELRDKYLKDADIAGAPHDLPFSVGCVVLLALKTDSSYQILIHKRSIKTATYSGYKSVIPSFGLTPMPIEMNEYSISFYNFIKEFAEELYDLEELNQLMLSKRGNITWFLDLPEIKEVINAFDTGKMEYIFTGFGIDTFNGTNTLSFLCKINDEALALRIKNKIRGNWEVETNEDEGSFNFIDINNKSLDQMLLERFHFGSAFCVKRGINYINQENEYA